MLYSSDLEDLKLGKVSRWPSVPKRYRHLKKRITAGPKRLRPFLPIIGDRFSVGGVTFTIKRYTDDDVMSLIALKSVGFWHGQRTARVKEAHCRCRLVELKKPEPVEAFLLEADDVSPSAFAGRVSPVDGHVRSAKEVDCVYRSRALAEAAARRLVKRVTAKYRQAIALERAA